MLEDNGEDNQGPQATVSHMALCEQIRIMTGSIRDLTRELAEVKAELGQERTKVHEALLSIKKGINRLGRAPHRVGVAPPQDPLTDNAPAQLVQARLGAPATLAPRVSDLYVLWQEYEVGIGGRKPACQFTADERGAQRRKYYRRRVFWDTVLIGVRRGSDHLQVIDSLYRRFGESSSVTKILDGLIAERRRMRRRQERARSDSESV